MGYFKQGRPRRDEFLILRNLARWFIKPLLERKPDQVTEPVFLDHIFNIRYRSIERYRAKEDFQMPGVYLDLPTRRVQGIGPRTVRFGSPIFVRHDTREPNVYQLSYSSGPGREEHVVELTLSEWEVIKRLLKVQVLNEAA